MEFKINFAFIVCIFFVVIFTISLIDELVKAIREKRKRKSSKQAYENLVDNVLWCQKHFLIKEHNFTAEQLDDKTFDQLCNECGYKNKCASDCYPKCLELDPELYSFFDSE